MITPQPGDRIERWLLGEGTAYASLMGRVEQWDPDEQFGRDREAGVQIDTIAEFERHVGTRHVDSLHVETGATTSAVYEMVACLPSQEADGHTMYRVLMRPRT